MLRSRYRFPKDKVLSTLVNLLETREIEFQDEGSVERALFFYRSTNADFAECLHLGCAVTHERLPLVTDALIRLYPVLLARPPPLLLIHWSLVRLQHGPPIQTKARARCRRSVGQFLTSLLPVRQSTLAACHAGKTA